METTYNDTAISYDVAKPCNGFWNISHKLLIEHRRGILRAVLAYWGFWVALGIIWGFAALNNHQVIWACYAMIGSFSCLAFASMTFQDMKTSEGRLSVLMTPASAAAKFWPRAIAAYLGAAIIMIIGYLCEETGRVLGDLIMRNHAVEFTLPTSTYLPGAENYQVYLMLVASAVLWQSIYFYGAILWPKSSFIKTSGFLVCLGLVLSMAGGFIISSVYFHDYKIELLVSEEALVWIILSVTIAISGLLIWMSYRRFKNSTLIYGLRQK